MRRALPLAALCLALAACGKDTAGGQDAAPTPPDCSCAPRPDAGSADADVVEPPDAAVAGLDAAPLPPDAAAPGPDAALPHLTEQEPNDLQTDGGYNAVTLPFEMTGTIQAGTHPDIDVLRTTLSAGDFWTWRVQSPGGKVSPTFYAFEEADVVPYLLSFAGVGQVAEQEQFVLASGPWTVVVADHRNPLDSNAVCSTSVPCVGGPDLDWKLTVTSAPRTPTAVTFPSTVDGALRHPRAIDLYGFHATSAFKFKVEVRAERKSPASDVWSQISLFDDTNRQWVITNDGQATTKDALISASSGLPATADYVLVVENTNPDAVDLSYQLIFTAL